MRRTSVPLAAAALPADLLAAYDRWIARAEEAYARQAWSEDFRLAQARLVDSLCELTIERCRAGANGRGPADAAPEDDEAARDDGGCSLREAVWRRGRTVLYRYRALPFVRLERPRPVLICYAQVNRPYVLDLEPRCSLVRRLVARGFTVYLIDWGYPDHSDSRTPLADYLERDLGGCIAHILGDEGVARVDLIGICQGGTFSLCYTALHPDRIANLVLMVAPVDFQTPVDLLSRWASGLDPRLIRRAGNVPGAALSAAFIALTPYRSLQQKYVHLLANGPSAADLERFLRLERWVFDSPDQPATAFSQFLQWFYQENRLLAGRLAIGGEPVRLRRIRRPVLNVYATRDRIVPPAASLALRGRVGSRDYTELPVASGHIGVFVSERTGLDVPEAVSGWLAARG
ncbi:MAG TPA: alpha/beta fold hydrolase [Steroidobacteraceae bacterium]|nr:alpha/beta fold hydrolase [Steroidobacteraceae bacterium]